MKYSKRKFQFLKGLDRQLALPIYLANNICVGRGGHTVLVPFFKGYE